MSRFICCILFLLLVAKGFGQGNCGGEYYKYFGQSDCRSPSCCFEIAAEWLYMLPAYDQPYFSIRNGSGDPLGPNFFDGERLANEQTWHSGLRLEASYYLPNKIDHIRARATYFPEFSDSREDDSSSAAILNFPLGGAFDAATFSSMKDEFNFYYIELLFGRPLYCATPLIISLEMGVEFAKLEFKERVQYTAASEIVVEYDSDLKGLGPELTCDFAYGICSWLSLNGRVTSSLIISKRDAGASQRNLTTGVTTGSTKNESYWRTSPILNFRLGLHYHKSLTFCGCKRFNLTVELGYEVLHFFKSADRIYFVDDVSNGSSFDQNMDFTLHGPYAHVGICF